jgi:predicted polyphosphate/ATP-dependent NAD kinase
VPRPTNQIVVTAGVAGGDGTQALVAGIAAEHDVQLLVIAAGIRNHSRGRRRCW